MAVSVAPSVLASGLLVSAPHPHPLHRHAARDGPRDGVAATAAQEDETDRPLPLEKMKLDHEKVDMRPTKNIQMKQHLCVKHALPKSRLTNTILYENFSHDRVLEMTLATLKKDERRSIFTLDLNRRAFVAQQDRKRSKWRREDELRVSAINLPTFPSFLEAGRGGDGMGPGRTHRPASVSTLYHMAGTASGKDHNPVASLSKALLPVIKVKRERTEIVSHADQVFITHLPAVVEVDQRKLRALEAYCGKQTLLARGSPARDQRFRRFHTTLSTALLKSHDQYPTENVFSKSRFSKYHPFSPAPSPDLQPPPSRRSEAPVMVATRGRGGPVGKAPDSSEGQGKRQELRPSVDFVTERKLCSQTPSRPHTLAAATAASALKAGASHSSVAKKKIATKEDRENAISQTGLWHQDDRTPTVRFHDSRDYLNIPSAGQVGTGETAEAADKPSGVFRDVWSGEVVDDESLGLTKAKHFAALTRSLTVDAAGLGGGTGLRVGGGRRHGEPLTLTDRPVAMTTQPRARRPAGSQPPVPHRARRMIPLDA